MEYKTQVYLLTIALTLSIAGFLYFFALPETGNDFRYSDIHNIKVVWGENDFDLSNQPKDIICKPNWCNEHSCGGESGAVITVTANITKSATCRVLIDGKPEGNGAGFTYPSTYFSTGVSPRINFKSKSNPDLPPWWDNLKITICCFANDDKEKVEICKEGYLTGLCP